MPRPRGEVDENQPADYRVAMIGTALEETLRRVTHEPVEAAGRSQVSGGPTMQRRKHLSAALVAVMVLLVLVPRAHARGEASPESNAYCGAALVQGVGDGSKEIFDARIKDASVQNMALLEGYARQQQLTVEDQLLIEKISANPPFITRRQPSQFLCDVLVKNGIEAFGINTPQVEKNLYSAGQCVFVSFGSPIGQPQYGDVVMTFRKEHLTGGWVTPHSGYYYASLHRVGFTRTNVEVAPEVSSREQRFFEQFIYADPAQWETVMIANFVLRYKALSQQEQEDVRNQLLSVVDRRSFQEALKDLSIQYGLEYYLEGHVDRFLPLEHVESIHVPESARSDVVSACPGAYERWSNIITFDP